ncbi:RseA family anti-sigma factor [Gallaecimonas sp. GXIMD4217]|uniref:sigma-E factor negative regulatory protein n=1 Tax=Gallaecimonas sp. GXIMD4217 TaxID=3131927 RepID=UPI00311AD949
MADKINETLSALLDSESHLDDGLLAKLKEDGELADRWQRYSLIGDALRGDLPQQVDLDISARVAQALESEPTLLAPQAGKAQPQAEAQQPEQQGEVIDASSRFGWLGNWGRSAAQFAVAASVTAVAIFGVQQYGVEGNPELNQPTPVLTTLPAIGGAAPVSLEARPQAQGRLSQAEQQRRVNAYLQDHAQQLRINDEQQEQQETP